MRRHRAFIVLVALELAALAIMHGAGVQRERFRRETVLPPARAIVRDLMLTDLSLWTEARYTRHPSQADLFAPFQDFPSALEHFPAGSIVGEPRRGNGFATSAAGASK